MRIGILSDSHGDADATAAAVALLLHRGANLLVHCGDLCGTAVLDQLVGHPVRFVWGNCDEPTAQWRPYVRSVGLSWPEPPLRFECDGKRIVVFHGHEASFRRVSSDGQVDYLLFGHTHVFEDRRIGPVRLINPGALHRARIHTVALLDLSCDRVEFLTLDGRIVG